MGTWRPPHTIRVKALGLHWRGGNLLATEVKDDAGRVRGFRPPGGGVEFGETAERAVIREFKEELGINIVPNGPPFFYENIYVHEGVLGHEILILFNVTFPEDAFARQDNILFHESNGEVCLARWCDLNALDLPGGPELYPAGLKAVLLRGAE